MSSYDIRKILVPTDFSQMSKNALHHAELLAHSMNADVELLHIIKPNNSKPSSNPQITKVNNQMTLLNETKMALKKVAKELVNDRVRTFFYAKMGRPVESIVDTVTENDINLIVMGYDNTHITNELSSNTLKLIRQSRCPIITVQPEIDSTAYQKIVIPIRNHTYILDKVKAIIPLATKTNADIHIVLFYPDFKQSAENAKITELFTNAIEMLKEHKIKTSYTGIMGGDYVKDTLLAAQKQKANLVVILANQSSFFSRLLGRTDEERFLKKSKIPLMTIPINYKGYKLGNPDKMDNQSTLLKPSLTSLK